MKRLLLLLPLLLTPAAQAMDESDFVPLPEVKSLYTWMPDSLRKFTHKDRRYLTFKGTTKLDHSKGDVRKCAKGGGGWRDRLTDCIRLETGKPVFTYVIDCENKTFNKIPDDFPSAAFIFYDKTAYAVGTTFCPINMWSVVKDRESD